MFDDGKSAARLQHTVLFFGERIALLRRDVMIHAHRRDEIELFSIERIPTRVCLDSNGYARPVDALESDPSAVPRMRQTIRRTPAGRESSCNKYKWPVD